jgi:pyrethroid hydrolase
MSEDFEIRLVRVQWSSKNQFAYISEIAQRPIRVSKQKDRLFTAEVPSYPLLEDNLACQFALKCKSLLNLETPKVKREDDNVGLFQISDPKHGNWWIEKGSWKNKYHDAPSCRHAGEFTVLVGGITIQLNIIPSGFTTVEYQELLSSFKGELWQLILDKDSTTSIAKDRQGKLPGEKFQKQVSKFIKFADQILEKPTEELREKQELQRIENARPTARTFMELSSRGSSVRFVTGRGFEPSYNTLENKYIADIISRLLLIVRNLRIGVAYSKESLDRSVFFIKKQISQASRNDFIQIDPAKLDAEIKQEKRKQKRWEERKVNFENYFSGINVNNTNMDYKEVITFKVKSAKIEEEYPNFIDVWLEPNKPTGALIKIPSESWLIKIPSESCDRDSSFFLQKATYKISKVYYEKNVYKKKENGTLSIAKIHKTSEIKILEDPFERTIVSLINEYDSYSKKNWQRKLTYQERQQKVLELQGVEKRKDEYASIACKYEEKLTSLQSIYKDLLSLSKKCKSLKITVENRLDYPGTMTFVQNPSYRGAYSSYKEIQNDAKLENLFDDLLIIQEYGITDQPNIYEKWCLLQIIKILDDYGFTQDNGWEAKLVNLVSEKKYATCSFLFTHPSLSQNIELIYQPVLDNHKTPDFMLKIKSNNGETVLVLDAKNKNYAEVFAQYNTFSDDLNNLVNIKNYSADGSNAVFILHPKKDKGFLPVLPTPQSWSSCTTLGGSGVFDWEDSNLGSPEHMYGGAQVRPENLDNLKMVIALSLQYLTEDNHKVYNKVIPENVKFCVVCGGTDFNMGNRCQTKGTHYTCQKCHHFFVEHYCRCGNRLWKHGSYWTYHDTRSTEPYNIKCPLCNVYYAGD